MRNASTIVHRAGDGSAQAAGGRRAGERTYQAIYQGRAAWFFKAREGDVGPFASQCCAMEALEQFIGFCIGIGSGGGRRLPGVVLAGAMAAAPSIAMAREAALHGPIDTSTAMVLAAAQTDGGYQADAVAPLLKGHNYVMKVGKDGAVESLIVSGDNGSGVSAGVGGARASIPSPSFDGVALAQQEPADAASPTIQLPEKMQGERAIKALGGKLAEVAAAHGMSSEKFKDILLKDASAWIDTGGRLFYVETTDGVSQGHGATVSASGNTAAATAPVDLAATFSLHSRPGAQRIVYLDFNGHAASSTAWSGTTINAPAFDLTGNPAVFDNTELERIQFIWRRVAEDYAAFDVDVTTEEPPADALTRSTSSDQTYGTRAVITKNVLNCSCGGVAYVGVFDMVGASRYQPAWVFYDMLGAGNEKYVAEAISHEVGHNLGLSHDGTAGTGYYAGHGSGATGWAPIMGVGYYKEEVQWSRGEYPGANNAEDDFDIIQSHGAALRSDDAGDTPGSANALAGTASGATVAVDQDGNIEQRSDVDYHVFATAGGTVNFTVSPTGRSPNLDISAGLYDAAGMLIVASNPVDSLGASLAANLAAGTYYLKIDGTGKTATATDPGYSDYGSLGQYKITGAYAGGTAVVAPVAAASVSSNSGTAPLAVSFSSDQSNGNGAIVAYRWDFGDGTAAADVANPLHTYENPGTYRATLTVTNDAGLTGTQSVTIQVKPDPAAVTLRVDQIAMRLNTALSRTQAVASVTVSNALGQPIANARVTGRWRGLVAGATRAVTDAAGVATLSSPFTKAKSGTFTFTVTGVSINGYTYDASKNTANSASISK